MIDVTTRERDRYLARVAARLQGLAPAEREELLDDLREHLAEVEAESEGDLEQLVGPPDRYADELLATAGLPTDTAARRNRLREAIARDRARLEPLLRHPEVAASIAGLRQARPAWWAFRGWLSVVALDAVFGSRWSGVPQVVPSLGGSRLMGLVAILVAVIGSVWLGRRTGQSWAHVCSVVGNLFLAFLLLLVTANLASAANRLAGGWAAAGADAVAMLWPEGALHTADGRIITNLYPYGPDGQPLEQVRLYDQDGTPVDIVLDELADGTPIVTSYAIDADGRPLMHAFPQRQAPRFDHGSLPPGPPAEVPPLRDPSPAGDVEEAEDRSAPTDEAVDGDAASDEETVDGADATEEEAAEGTATPDGGTADEEPPPGG